MNYGAIIASYAAAPVTGDAGANIGGLAVQTETGNPQMATITFNLGNYNGPILLALSIWTGGRYMAYETQNIAEPTLQRNGQTATLSIETNPAETRFRLDGTRNGLRQLPQRQPLTPGNPGRQPAGAPTKRPCPAPPPNETNDIRPLPTLTSRP